jgi:hypothetical protein
MPMAIQEMSPPDDEAYRGVLYNYFLAEFTLKIESHYKLTSQSETIPLEFVCLQKN